MKDVIKMELLAIKIAELEIEKEQYKLLFEQYKENYIEHVSQPTYHFYQYYLNQYEMVSAKLEFFKNELIKVREE